ncbi:hypothetical protein POSPLADRAFT_1037634 [Postia placenta MAD-698-R-SB12]|uniref:Uncharacterized protein n=1 Tax=Postia placenta MAD-698-R-SB12 TaxID=670580 RepID=A0A1X6MIY0_9APHY|nr:hypothetical protein POSPLADRAFT_1037634 [Postia placenta MAD-698-R-SB12]OSX56196.1 hypothetical protein POSPLADRAFT_1037634 [Postia placenta MAD-698-R-SB12]
MPFVLNSIQEAKTVREKTIQAKGARTQHTCSRRTAASFPALDNRDARGLNRNPVQLALWTLAAQGCITRAVRLAARFDLLARLLRHKLRAAWMTNKADTRAARDTTPRPKAQCRLEPINALDKRNVVFLWNMPSDDALGYTEMFTSANISREQQYGQAVRLSSLEGPSVASTFRPKLTAAWAMPSRTLTPFAI